MAGFFQTRIAVQFEIGGDETNGAGAPAVSQDAAFPPDAVSVPFTLELPRTPELDALLARAQT